MNNAIFLGTFNPPHIGHVSVICAVIDYLRSHKNLGIDKIHIIPCWQNPNKNDNLSYIDRYYMCSATFCHISEKIQINDIESFLKPKYTYQLIDYLHKFAQPFWWIITDETLYEILQGKWKNGPMLLSENKFIVVSSGKFDISNIDNTLKENIIVIQLNKELLHDIHSTKIRNIAKIGGDISKYVNKSVESYIVKNKLYQE